MKTLKSLFFLPLMLAFVAGCMGPKTSEDKAAWFYGKGEDMVIDSLKDQNASDAKVEAAQKVIDQYRKKVNVALGSYIKVHKAVMEAIIGGKTGADLVKAENKAHEEHVKVLTLMGKMHDELESTVGKEIWLAAAKQRQKKFNERFR